MEKNAWVKWTQWGESGVIACGEMPVKNVARFLRQFAAEARKVLIETGADHVVYGLKEYDENDDLKEVGFYMLPLDDATFTERTESLHRCTVYALHKGTAC